MHRPGRWLTILAALHSGLAATPSPAADPPTVVRFEPAPGPLANPLKGWCPYVNAGPIRLPYSMVYHYVSWKELEPAPGHYDFDGWERRVWNVPEGLGKHVVFRVTIDYPGRPSGLPDWLRDQVRLTPYSAHGGGLSPDYDDPDLTTGMERLIAALGQRYDRDPRVAFIELGLLGHWGEWHTWPQERLAPARATEARVIAAYHAAFPTVGLMARSARDAAGQQSWLGFHDDMFPEDTDNGQDWSFLAGIRRSKRLDNWQTAPIGGEMVPGAAAKWLGAGYAQTLAMVERSHFSWVGPYCPAIGRRGTDAEEQTRATRAAELVRKMGYQFRWDECRYQARVETGAACPWELRGVNDGVAPFYRGWAVEVALLDKDNAIAARSVVATDVRSWLPGPVALRASPTFAARPWHYRLVIGIIDPRTNAPGVEFANQGATRDKWFPLGPIEVIEPAR